MSAFSTSICTVESALALSIPSMKLNSNFVMKYAYLSSKISMRMGFPNFFTIFMYHSLFSSKNFLCTRKPSS
ncbi:Uncharacterised protein [uncultured archaeon]|nr:Uncharacterised protein [uncultured archaeon]